MKAARARLAMIASTALLAVGLLGCGRWDARSAASSAPSPGPTATAAAAAPAVEASATVTFPATPGVPLELNPIINAVLMSAVDTLQRSTLLSSVACGPQGGGGSPPPCPTGAPAGTKVEVLPVATCEGEYRLASALSTTYQQLVDAANKRLIGVYRAPRPYLPHVNAEYVAVFSRDVGGSNGVGAGLAVKDGKISGIWFGCNTPPSQIVPRGTDALWLRGG